VNLDESLAADDELADLEWEGHVVGDVWQVRRVKGRVFLDREIITSVVRSVFKGEFFQFEKSLKNRESVRQVMGGLLCA
jgi:hypothetical protein